MRKAEPGIAIPTAPAIRKKSTGVRSWLVMDSMGQTQVLEAGKYPIMRRTGLPARDLRVLDPFLSYPSTVLGRERAIVINLEHVKAIIMAKEVLLLNSMDPFVRPFVQELQKRILAYHQATLVKEVSNDASNQRNSGNLEAQPCLQKLFAESPHFEDQDKGSKVEGKHAFRNQDGSNVLPFEFIALEACLEAACSSLDNEAKTMEMEAHPALDKLTSQISTQNLERVRQVKSRLVAITGRVQKVRDELEHLLDDGDDMAEMYLTNKLAQQELERSSSCSTDDEDNLDDDNIADMEDRLVSPETAPAMHQASISYGGDIQNDDIARDQLFSALKTLSAGSQQGTHLNVGELEMLLEAYFVQIDGTLNKLSTLKEYVDDTEDYINIMLDDKQNQLLQMGVMLTTATIVFTLMVIATGVLSMNVRISIFLTDVSQGMPRWITIGCGCTAGMIALYIMALSWYKYEGYI